MRRARTPTVLQMEAVECGAACLAMVLAYHGRWEPLESLRKRDDLNRGLLNEQAKMLSSTVGSIAVMETLKSGGLENDAFARWAGHQATTLSAQQSLGEVSSVLSVTPRLLSGISSALILAFGGIHVMQGTLSIGALVAVQTLMASINQPVEKLVALGDNLLLAKGDLAWLADVFRYRRDEAPDRRVEAPQRLRGELELRDVSFGYNPLDPPLIQGLKFHRFRGGSCTGRGIYQWVCRISGKPHQ